MCIETIFNAKCFVEWEYHINKWTKKAKKIDSNEENYENAERNFCII